MQATKAQRNSIFLEKDSLDNNGDAFKADLLNMKAKVCWTDEKLEDLARFLLALEQQKYQFRKNFFKGPINISRIITYVIL